MKTLWSALLLSGALAFAVPAEAGLLHFYTFDSNADDSAGSANGTLQGGATVSGGVLHLRDTTQDYVQFATHLVPVSGDYTVMLDFQETADNGGIREFISQGSSGGAFYMGVQSGNYRVTDYWTNSGVGFPGDTGWHHMAMVSDNGNNNTFLYIDGTLRATLNSAIPTTTSAGTDTRFGKQFEPFTEYINANMDNVRIYDAALSAQDIGDVLTGVPEPDVFGLTGLGLAAMAFVRRRKRNAE